MGPLLVLLALVTLGLALDALGVFHWRGVLEWARGHTDRWWLAAAVILVQTVLFAFALPGSSLVWLAAPLYPPLGAALILAAGGTTGALSAYLLARRLGGAALENLRQKRWFRLLHARGDFSTLCALRLLPGFPNSVINYASGALRLPLPRFLAATALGLGVKNYVYSSAIHGTLGVATVSDLLRAPTLAPLLLLVLLLLLGGLARRRWSGRASGG
jgi:uncharacterized membrane protein YdjX (TVP38/TMEM64 family)